MTKKDYELIAESIRRGYVQAKQSNNAIAIETIENIMADVAESLHNDNPRFDKQKFFLACE